MTSVHVYGITGDEPPLTPADIRDAVAYALGGWFGDWLLDGGDRAHHVCVQMQAGCSGWINDRRSVSADLRRDGLHVCITEHREPRGAPFPRSAPVAVRAGRIPWRQAEEVLRAIRSDDGALFSLEVS